MQKSTPPSKVRVVACAILAILGFLGLIQSSIFSLSVVIFSSASDRLMLLRVLVVFIVSVSFLVCAAKLGGDIHWLKNSIRNLAFVVVAFGCLGLVKTIFNIYEHRQPPFLNKFEAGLLISSLVVFGICIWWLRRTRKRDVKAAGQFIVSNDELTLRRTLKPAPRPYIALGIVFGAVALLGAIPIFVAGKPEEAAKMSAAIFVMYGTICWVISRQRIFVANDYIAFKALGKSASGVYFKDISKSARRILAEREHPFNLNIYTYGHQQCVLRIPLKPFRQSDVAWLLSIPELKVQE